MSRRRSTVPPQRYERTGLLAIDPKAFFELFIVPATRDNEMIGEVCVVDICGPLDQHDTGWGDSYEAVRARMAEACKSTAKAIVMRLDSPGGDVAGCFETARALRAMAQAARKPLFAYCDRACSAGYALASAASFVGASETSTIGSIGVLQTRPDFSTQNAMRGVRVEFIASGARKIDGHVDAPITGDEIENWRTIVEYTAGIFYALIETHRGVKASALAELQAAVMHVEAAKRAGLVDEVMSFETMLARASGGHVNMSVYDDAKAKLEEAAKGDDANAAAAKRALAALNDVADDDDGKDKEDESAEAGDDDDKQAAAGDDDKQAAAEGPADDDKKPPKPPAAESGASAQSIALQALAEVHELKAERASDKAKAERKRLLDSRPDFSAELRAELMKASTPIETVRNMVKTLKRAPIAKPSAAAAASGTRGESAGTPASLGSDPRSADAIALDRKMGLVEQTLGVKRVGNSLTFGIVDKQPQAAAGSGTGGAK